MSGLTWIHISDWCQKGIDSNFVFRNALIYDIEKRTSINEELAKIDFIIVSGDIAYSGQDTEYMAAIEQFFDPILNICDLGRDRLFIIPGNHDLNRDEFDLLPAALLKPLESEEEIHSWLGDDRRKERLLEPFRAFTKFVSEYTGQDRPDYASIRIWQISGRKIAVLGINSAWMCGRGKDENGISNDKGFVLVGEPQIKDSLDIISDADIKIAVLHHPLEWLAEFDRILIEDYLTQRCDFVLHSSKGSKAVPRASNSAECIIIPAGGDFIDRKMEYTFNSYNYVHLDLETGIGSIFQRKWNTSQIRWIEKWVQDDVSFSEGIFNFRIPHSGIKRVSTLHNQLPSTNLTIMQIELRQIRCFEKLSISFQDIRTEIPQKWIMILGDNSTGKSTLLRSIAIALCNESDATSLMRKMSGDFIRKGAKRGDIVLTLMDEKSKNKYIITTTITKIENSRGEILRKDISPKEGFLWRDVFICGYGTHRNGIADTSYDGYSPINALSTLFDTNASLQNPEVVLLKSKDRYKTLSNILLRVLMLDEGSNVFLPEKPDESAEISGPWGKLPINSLSEGYRSTLQWLLDFLAWSIYAGRLDTGNVIGGILLIDELEQHLHPRWQRYIVQRLAEKLPHTQVISTTHTPLVAAAVSDLPSSGILKLSLESGNSAVSGELIKPNELHGKRADQILADLFDLETSRTLGSQDEISRYSELAAKKRTNNENEELLILSESLRDKLTLGENSIERDVEKAVHKVLEMQLKSPLSELYDLEIRTQIKKLFEM